mmetsp:Transcript_48986/g.140798  ORF Transcript_48986/g.140798 Transcript_48986/m.140798 type:complete len:230 (-) Transcript_48986:478-1167(-)
MLRPAEPARKDSIRALLQERPRNDSGGPPNMQSRAALVDVLLDRGTVLPKLLRCWTWRAVLQLNFDVRNGSQPKLPLRQGACGKQLVFYRETAATDAHLLAACAMLCEYNFSHNHLASFRLVHDDLAIVMVLRMQLAVQCGDQRAAVVVQQVPRHQPPGGKVDRIQGLASDLVRRKQRLCDQANCAGDIDYPPRSLFLCCAVIAVLRPHSEVKARALREQRQLETLKAR